MRRALIRKHVQRTYKEIRKNIFTLCAFLKFKPTEQQALVLQAVQDAADKGRGNVAVKSGQGPGKTKIAGIIAVWRLIRWPRSLVIITAPTKRQCCDVFLATVKDTLKKSPTWFFNLFDIQATKIRMTSDEDWAIHTVTATKVENAQGYHRPLGLTVIYDEASGVARPIWEQFKGTQTGMDVLHLAIGNPNTRDCAFFDCFHKNRERWDCITLNCEESPDWLVNKDNLAEMKEEFGEDSDVYRIRVKGEFPIEDPNCVMSSERLTRVTRPELLLPYARIKNSDNKVTKQYGIDLARFGGDESVVFVRQGEAIVEWKVWSHTEPTDVIKWCFRDQIERRWKDKDTTFCLDASGIGQGVLGLLYGANKKVIEFHNHGKPLKPRIYDHRIAEAWFELAKKVKRGKVYIPNDGRTIYQLSSRQYHFTEKNTIKLESKEDYKKRTDQPSPDRGEACVYAFYDDPYGQITMVRKGGKPRKVGMVG